MSHSYVAPGEAGRDEWINILLKPVIPVLEKHLGKKGPCLPTIALENLLH